MGDIYSPGTGVGISRAALDPERCKAGVWSNDRWSTYAQCQRKAVTDGWCKQHHPDAKRLREIESRKRYDADMFRSSFGWNGRTLLAALRKIADGDNDPRATATDALRRCGQLDNAPTPIGESTEGSGG